MKPILEIYWSFRSPFTWLAADRLIAISRDYAIETRWRQVRPIALREPGFFENARPQLLPYLIMDARRESMRLGLPFTAPRPDPIVMDMKTGEVADEQPHFPRLMALGFAADYFGQAGPFVRAVTSRIWGGKNWADDAAMEESALEAGLVLSELEEWAAMHTDQIARIILVNEADQMKNHWGVPLMVLDGEAFFGQDRIDALRWRLDDRKLKR